MYGAALLHYRSMAHATRPKRLSVAVQMWWECVDTVRARNTKGAFNRMPVTQSISKPSFRRCKGYFCSRNYVYFNSVTLWPGLQHVQFISVCDDHKVRASEACDLKPAHRAAYRPTKANALLSNSSTTCIELGMVQHPVVAIVNLEGWFEHHAGSEW